MVPKMPCTDTTRVFSICVDNGAGQRCNRFRNRRCAWVNEERSRCFNVLFDNANGANEGEDARRARRGLDVCPETCFSRDKSCPQPPLPGPNSRVSVSTTAKPSTISSSKPSQKPTNGRVPSVSITAEPATKQTQRPVSSLSITAEPTAN